MMQFNRNKGQKGGGAVKIKILLRQHVGGPCKPIVEVGDDVERGQLIAVPEGLGANIHASLSGKVLEINDGIIIDAVEEQTSDYVKIKETDSYLEAVKEAGVVGAGGAGFPAHIKFGTKLEGGCVIINAAECEPVLGHNIKYIEENPEVMIRGLKYVMEMTGAEKGYIAIKTKYKKAMLSLGKLAKDEADVEIKFLPDMYPAGDERVIVREILGVVLEPGQLPSVAGAIISNVETIKNVVLAIEERKPVIDKDVTVGGKINGNPDGVIFMDVPIGMPIKHYIDLAGGYAKNHGEIVVGGPFTGKRGEETTPITKTSGGILIAVTFPNESRKVGILACECGAQEERLRQIAESMGATVVAEEKCKRMVEVNGRFRCDKPGECPGQTEKVLSLKKQGAEVIIAGSCQD